MKFNTITRKFPLYTDRLSISVLGKRDIKQYANEIRQPYFIEYLDNKSILNMSAAEVEIKLASLIATYHTPLNFIYEYRLMIKDNVTGTVYGGITLFPTNTTKDMEIAYWIKPIYQNNGFATEAVKRIIEFIFNINEEIKSIKLVIQESNLSSIKLAERCGFKQSGNKLGTYGINKIYCIWR